MKQLAFLAFTCMLVALSLAGCAEKPGQVAGVELQLEPLVNITAPAWGAVYAMGDTMCCRGTARDIDDESDLVVQWWSNVDGILNEDAPDSAGLLAFDISSLSYSEHFIRVFVTDSDGNVAADSVFVYNNLPTRVNLFDIETAGFSALLTWTKSRISDFASYRVFRSMTPGQGESGELVVEVGAAGDTAHVDVDVPPAASWYYQVFVVNESGLASGSNEESTAMYIEGDFYDGFEDGAFCAEWFLGGDADWYVTDTESYSGLFCARSGPIGHGEMSRLITTVAAESSGSEVSFRCKTSTEGCCDRLRFYVDGDELANWSGHNGGWEDHSCSLAGGLHELEWRYTKDGSVHSGEDCVWIDDVYITAVSPAGAGIGER